MKPRLGSLFLRLRLVEIILTVIADVISSHTAGFGLILPGLVDISHKKGHQAEWCNNAIRLKKKNLYKKGSHWTCIRFFSYDFPPWPGRVGVGDLPFQGTGLYLSEGPRHVIVGGSPRHPWGSSPQPSPVVWVSGEASYPAHGLPTVNDIE